MFFHSLRYYAVMYESFMSRKTAIFFGFLGVAIMIAHSAFFSLVNDNISSLQRSCHNPNAKFEHPKDTTYIISMIFILTYNLTSFFLCLMVYIYLLDEENKATFRNRQDIEVSKSCYCIIAGIELLISKSAYELSLILVS